MDPNANAIAATALAIADAYGCHTVLLYRSRPRGDVDEGSDVDVLCIRDDGPSFRDSRVIDGIYFDVFIYPRDAAATVDGEVLRILCGLCLRERAGEGTALLSRVRDRFDRGPDPLPADDQTARIVWAHKKLTPITARR